MTERRTGSCLPFLLALTSVLVLCGSATSLEHIGKYSLPFAKTLQGRVLSLPAGVFILLYALTWIASIGLLLVFPRKLSRPAAGAVLLVSALACRMLLIPMEPSDDVNRYLWEGRLLAEGISPYVHAPDSAALADLASRDPFHPAINHPDMAAAYPPLMIAVFSLTGRISYTATAIKILVVLFDMGTLWCLLALLKKRGLPARWACLYAFNPIVLYGFSGHGHFDAAQGFFLLAALVMYDKRRWAAMFLLAGLAVQTKYVAIVCLPFFLRRDNWRQAWISLAVIALPYVPFALREDPHLLFSLTQFGRDFSFNGSVASVLRAWVGDLRIANSLCKGAFILCLLPGYWLFHPERNPKFKADPVAGCLFALGALLVLAPTVHAWYITWIVALLALRPTASWLMLCLTIGFYFVAVGIQYHTGKWELPRHAQFIEWVPFWLLLVRDVRLGIRRAGTAAPHPPASVSVVVPALNEAERIAACVRTARTDKAVHEVIVVDGGSEDGTAELAREAGARVLAYRPPTGEIGGRGGQIATGITRAVGDVVVIVHADSLVAAPAFTDMLYVLQNQPDVIGGSYGSVFDGHGPRLRLIEYANDLKAALFGISFGDQVQFFRREPVLQHGAFRAIPLMEDVELSLRLKGLGRTVHLFGDAVVSSRSWQNGGLKRLVLVLRLVAEYLVLRRRRPDQVRRMYENYYGRTPSS